MLFASKARNGHASAQVVVDFRFINLSPSYPSLHTGDRCTALVLLTDHFANSTHDVSVLRRAFSAQPAVIELSDAPPNRTNHVAVKSRVDVLARRAHGQCRCPLHGDAHNCSNQASDHSSSVLRLAAHALSPVPGPCLCQTIPCQASDEQPLLENWQSVQCSDCPADRYSHWPNARMPEDFAFGRTSIQLRSHLRL